VPALKHPRRKAPPEQWAAYRQAVKKTNLSTHAVTTIAGLRTSLDEAGQQAKRLLIVGDGSFCNRTLFTAALERTEIIARARRDLKLCRKADTGKRLFYDKAKFTPEQVRQDESLVWRKARIFHGGQWRKVRYKEITDVYWQTGARQRPLRLFVVAPIPYQSPGRQRKYYRDPAFLLTTDLTGTPRELLQAYFDSLADRGQSQRRERHPRYRPGTASIKTFGATTAGLCRGRIQCAPSRSTPDLWSAPRYTLSSVAKVASKRRPALLSRPDHPRAQRYGRKSIPSRSPRLQNRLASTRPCRRCLIKCPKSRRRDESRRCMHECVRHDSAPSSISCL
jgi:hypothetical protein